MRVTHVITGLGTGGAETMLWKLVSATRDVVRHSVVSLTDEGTFGAKLRAGGVAVSCLRMRPGIPDPLGLARLVRILRSERSDVVQGWMYHANLVAGVAGAIVRTPVVWGIRRTDVDPRHVKRLTLWINRLCARLSGTLPERVVCCAESGLRSHVALGYRRDRMIVIPNGFDLTRFAPDAAARAEVRRELGIEERAPVVGLVARFHPDKDHRTFLSAAATVAREERGAAFVLAGTGIDATNRVLSGWIHDLALGDRVRLLGARGDVPRLLSAFDVLASSSRSEGFSQVLGEAMACGVPCAVTDCGDSPEVVGDTGRVVPTWEPAALARAVLELLSLPAAERSALGARARERVRQRYDLAVVARSFRQLYEEVASRPGARAA